MNITDLILQLTRYYGASLELTDDQTIRICSSEPLPSHVLELIRTHKTAILRRVALQPIYDLIQNTNKEGARLTVLDSSNIRIDNAENLTTSHIEKIKTFKSSVVQLLQPSPQQRLNDSILEQCLFDEAAQVYFARLAIHQANLIKINNPVENALVSPKQLQTDLMVKFKITMQQAQQIIKNMIHNGMLRYDSSYRNYIIANDQHPAIKSLQAKQQYNSV